VRCWQPRRGYRWGVEVYALAAFALAGESSPASAADLGTGSGILALLLAHAGLRVEAWERAPEWHAAAERSIAESGLDVRLHRQDIRDAHGPRRFDVVVANPPWFPTDQPRSPDPWRAACRSMLHGDTRAFVDAGLRLAPRVCLVTRPARREDLAGYRVARHALLGTQVLLVEIVGSTRPTDAHAPWPPPETVDLVAAYARFGRTPVHAPEAPGSAA
jgi:release factor glutamine methyltransferase